MLFFDFPNDTRLVKKGEVDTELVPMPMAKNHVSELTLLADQFQRNKVACALAWEKYIESNGE